MSNSTIAGKPSNTIGEKDSTLILRGSSIKIQWGNKFIDLIKNGKINSDSLKLLKTANSTNELITDGIYLVEDSVWAVIGGTKVLLSDDNTTTYISYLTEQKDITGELKEKALTNIGFYYKTLEEALNSGLTSGIIYVLGDNKLYIIKEGIISEYGMAVNNSLKPEETEKILKKLYILDYSLMVDNEEYVIFDSNNISFNKIVYFKEGINSLGATADYGYRLYMENGKSYLEVDNIIERNKIVDSGNINIQKIKYYQDENIILGINSEDRLVLKLLYSDKYKVGDILTTSILLKKEITTPNEELTGVIELVLIPVDFRIDAISDDKKEYTVTIISEEKELILKNIQSLLNKILYYKLGELPIARISEHNYDLFEPNKQTLLDIVLRIGSLYELELSDYVSKDLGLYSNNSCLKNPSILESVQYGTIFKNYNGIYPKYEDNWFIPEDSNDLTIVTSLWINNKLKPIYTDIDIIKELLEDIDDLEEAVNDVQSEITKINKNISDLETNINTINSDITSIQTNVNTLQTDLNIAETNIDNIWNEIDNINNTTNDNLQTQINELASVINDLLFLPRVLISGVVFRDNADSLVWKFTGIVHPKLNIPGSVYNYVNSYTLSTSINGGVLCINWGSNRLVNIVTCCANMRTSGLVTSSIGEEYMSTDRARGMYWLGTDSNGTYTYIRAMTLDDRNNDTAISYDELWGPVNESHKNGILSFSIIVTGYIM